MRNFNGLFFQLVISVVTENPFRDKIHISSCENSIGQPEMTIVGPDFILNGKPYHIGQNKKIEKIVNRKDLIMKSNDECEFKSFKILPVHNSTNWVI